MDTGTCFSVCLLVLTGGLGAQQGLGPAVPLTANARPSLWRCDPGKSPGLKTKDDEGVLGIGRGYKVRFDRRGFAFTPALGEGSPRNFPLRLELEAVGREAVTAPVETARPEIDGVCAILDRGLCVERCTLEGEAMKHDIVFEHLPPGTGDLVAAFRVTTELVATARESGGLDFLFENRLGVRFGAVLGRDARGGEFAGTMRLDGDRLELRLPAAHVDEAELPLILDPLLSPVQLPTLSATDERRPDAAHGLGGYLVAYEIVFSASDHDVYGVAVSSQLGRLGSLLPLATTANLEAFASVAYIEKNERFVVAWEDVTNHDIRGCTVRALSWNLERQFLIAGGRDVHRQPDVGGDTTRLDDEAIVVWDNDTQNVIFATQVSVDANGVVSLIGLTRITAASPNPVGSPKISKTGGDIGRYCIVYREDNPGRPDLSGILAGFYDRNLTALANNHLVVAARNNRDDDEPAVDGDGILWTVAWESELNAGSGANEIHAYTVGVLENGNPFLFANRQTVASAPGRDFLRAEVGYAGGYVLIGYHQRDSFSTNSDLAVQSVSLVDCRDCEGFFDVATSSSSGEYNVRIAGDPFLDEALLVYERRAGLTSASPGDIYGRMFEFDGGYISDRVQSCGNGGRAVASCPRYDVSEFRIALLGGEPSRGTFLILSPVPMLGASACGSCALLPDPMVGWIFARSADSNGKAEVHLPIPPGAGYTEMFAQWITPSFAPGCITFQSDFSSGLRIFIQ